MPKKFSEGRKVVPGCGGLFESDEAVIDEVGERIDHVADDSGDAVARNYDAEDEEVDFAEGAFGEYPHHP